MYSPIESERAAESEGLAAERLAELLGTEPPQTRRQTVLGQWRAAAALGLSGPPKMPPYRRAASCRVHAYLTERAPWRVLVWGRPQSKRLPADGAAEKIRQAEKRLRRAALLVRLRYMPAREPLTLPMASSVAGIGMRTLERAVGRGRVASERRDGRRIVRAGELRRLLAAKLKGRPIAA